MTTPSLKTDGGSTYEEHLKLREAERRRSSAMSTTHGGQSPKRSPSGWGERLTENSKSLGEASPAKQPKTEALRRSIVAKTYAESLSTQEPAPEDVPVPSTPQKPAAPEDVPLPDTPQKSATSAQSPTAPEKKAIAPEDIPIPSTPSKQESATQSQPSPETKGPIPDIGAVRAALAVKWKEQQEVHGVPDAAKLSSQVEEMIRFETSSRNFEQGMDGNDQAIDPRYSFRQSYTEDVSADPTKAGATWADMLTGKIDPRHSFRRAASAVKDSVLKRPAPATQLGIDPETNHSKLTPRPQPTTWLEKILADYPGGWQYDVLFSIGVPLFVLTILTVSLHRHQLVRPACVYGAVRTISALGPTFQVPDFCILLENYITPTDSAIVMDPLGIGQVLEWPLALPHLKRFNHIASHPVYPFHPIDDGLRKSAAFIASNVEVKALSHSAAAHVEAIQAFQNSITGVTDRYDTFITDLLQWSNRTSIDMHNIAQTSFGVKQSFLLLWGPALGYRTPVGEIKEKLHLPVQELVGDARSLANQINVTTHAIEEARTSREEFRLALHSAEEYFVERCLIRGYLGLYTISKTTACRGWDPRVIKKVLEAVEFKEDRLFETTQEHLNQLIAPVWSLGKFYHDVLPELGDVKSRTYGDVTFETLDSLRSFVQRFGLRTEASAGVLKVKMVK